jgi:PPK2 family polyphosphate:nucleotide phosphotransferase
MDFSTNFFVRESQPLHLSDTGTTETGEIEKNSASELLSDLKSELFNLQDKLYAENKKSVLVIFQAMDAAGKDSAIKHVMSGLNPQGCQVFSFKQPTLEELDHDFLWRHYKALPERGRIGIHNRSHYENVLICKVHPKFAANESQLPLEAIDESFWESRYRSIKDFEEHLSANGTKVIKFFLHISKDEQRKRFLKRIDDPAKNWKFAAADLAERGLWDRYMQAYQEALLATSTPMCPWYVIPADKKWFARLAICQILVDTLRAMNPQYPMLLPEDEQLLHSSKTKLLAETQT